MITKILKHPAFIAQNLKQSQGLIEYLVKGGVQFGLSEQKVTLHFKDGASANFFHLPGTGKTFNQIKATVSSGSKEQENSYALNAWLKEQGNKHGILMGFWTPSVKAEMPDPEVKEPHVTINADTPAKGLEAMGLPKVQLINAKALYQPVRGTSEGSTYFVAALSPEIKAAVRYKGGKLSVRIEGPVAKYHAALKAAGFKVEHGHGYASIHLEAHDEKVATRALGALISDVHNAVGFTTPLPQLKLLVGKGVA